MLFSTVEIVPLGYCPEYGLTQSSSALYPCPSSTISSATASEASRSASVNPCYNDTMVTTTDPLLQHLPLIIGVPVGLGLAGIGVLACIIWLLCSAYFQSKKKYYTSGGGSHSMVSYL